MNATPKPWARWSWEQQLSPPERQFIQQAGHDLAPWPSLLRSQGEDLLLRAAPMTLTSLIERLFEIGWRASDRSDDSIALGALALALRLWDQHGHPDPGISMRIISHLATALYRTGALADAIALQEVLLQRLRAGDAPAEDVIRVAGSLAQMWLDDGRVPEALTLQREALKLASAAMGPGADLTRSLRSDLSASLARAGQIELALDAVREAELELGERCSEAVEGLPDSSAAAAMAANAETSQAATLPASRDPSSSLDLIAVVARVNQAAIHFQAHQYEQAMALESHAASWLEERLGPRHRYTCIAWNNLAMTLKRMGRMAEAAALQAQTWERVSSGGFDGTAAALVLANYMTTLAELGDADAALAQVEHIWPQLLHASHLGARQLRLAAMGAWAITTILARQEAPAAQRERALILATALPALSRALSETAEVLDLRDESHALRDFESFHEQWARSTLLGGLSTLVPAVGALHGLDSWASLLNLVDPATGVPATPARTAFVTARAQLATQRDRLTSTERIGLDAPDELTISRWRQEERDARQCYAQARAALWAEEPGLAWLAPDHLSARLADPHALLKPGQILLLTVSLGSFGDIAQLISAGGATLTLRLPGLSALARVSLEASAAVPAQVLRGDAPSVLDPSARGVGRRAAAVPLARYLEDLQQTFWKAVLTRWPQQDPRAAPQTLIVVTAPDHHALPLEAANPGVRALYYCGLPAWLRQACSPAPEPPFRPSSWLWSDPAWESGRPIPFTTVEARLAELVLSCEGPVTHGSLSELAAPATRLLVSCHGTLAGGGAARYGTLVLDADQGLTLDAGRAAALAAQAHEIVVSACLAGRVGRSRWGDALGLVAQWQLQGVRAIVACIAPVADFYMPLLVLFYWQHRLARQPADQALRQAKQQLMSGEWPDHLLDAIRQTYADALQATLLRGVQANTPVAREAVLQVVGSWPLDIKLRDRWLKLREANAESAADGKRLALNPCRTAWGDAVQRARWINPCLDALIALRHTRQARGDALQAQIHAQLAHLCAVTLCYGT